MAGLKQRIANSNGAGDTHFGCYIGGLAQELTQGDDLIQANKYASSVAANNKSHL